MKYQYQLDVSKMDNIEKKQTEFLYEVSKLFVTIKDMNLLFNSLFSLLAVYFSVVRGMINVYIEEIDEIHIDKTYGYNETDISDVTYKPGEGIIGTVIKTGNPIVIPSVEDEPNFLNRTKARKSNSENISFICVPIKITGTTIGTISLDLIKKDDDFSEELQILTTLSIMIAHAVQYRLDLITRESELESENRLLKQKLIEDNKIENIIGRHSLIDELKDKITMVSQTNTTVLITGESGTGKELVADAIHFNSDRADKPFIKVNIAALPENLIESELFGYEKGAFTGALKQKKGRFELANGGTIFLDEIGDLNHNLQVHLLRVIQEKSIERLGGTHTLTLDVRIIAATHQDLNEKMQNSEFRSDLFYRLNVFPVHIPALRDRISDIILLADYFLDKFNKKYDKSIKRISSEAIDMLIMYHWPGNVRELENAIERSIIINKENVLRNYHLPPSLQIYEPSAEATTFEELTNLFHKELIVDHLKNTQGNITIAAKNLGTTKRILNYKIKKLNIDFKKYKNH